MINVQKTQLSEMTMTIEFHLLFQVGRTDFLCLLFAKNYTEHLTNEKECDILIKSLKKRLSQTKEKAIF